MKIEPENIKRITIDTREAEEKKDRLLFGLVLVCIFLIGVGLLTVGVLTKNVGMVFIGIILVGIPACAGCS